MMRILKIVRQLWAGATGEKAGVLVTDEDGQTVCQLVPADASKQGLRASGPDSGPALASLLEQVRAKAAEKERAIRTAEDARRAAYDQLDAVAAQAQQHAVQGVDLAGQPL